MRILGYQNHSLVVLCVLTAFKGSFYIWTIYLLFASTFKPNGSLSSTDENKEKSNYKDWKSESDLVEALISSPKVCLPINQAHLITFSFTRYQLPVFASLNKSAGSQIKCCCKIECVQSLLACWTMTIDLSGNVICSTVLLSRQQSWMKLGFRRWSSWKPRYVRKWYSGSFDVLNKIQYVSLLSNIVPKILCLHLVGWVGGRQRGLGQKLGGGGELSSGATPSHPFQHKTTFIPLCSWMGIVLPYLVYLSLPHIQANLNNLFHR